jgi:uncharacterized protein YcbX
VMLTAGQCLPHDRRFALAHAATHFDPTRPEWLPKTSFLMLMRDEKLAQLRTHFDEQSGYFTIERDGQMLLRVYPKSSAARKVIQAQAKWTSAR